MLACILGAKFIFFKKIASQIDALTGRNEFDNRITELTLLCTGSWSKLWEIKTTGDGKDAGETKLKVEGEKQGEGEGVGEGNERSKLLNFNDTEYVNVHITYIKCGKLPIPHVNGADQLICRLAR